MSGLKKMPLRKYLFFIAWLITIANFGWQIAGRGIIHSQSYNLMNHVMIVICTITLIMWFPVPLHDHPNEKEQIKWGRFIIVSILTTIILVLLNDYFGQYLVYVLIAVAIVGIIIIKPRLTMREISYALILSLVVGITGLGNPFVEKPFFGSILQFLLVLTSVLAGWALLRLSGLAKMGIGISSFLSVGLRSSIIGFFQGILISLPWALNLIADGSHINEIWVCNWWQPLFAINPGISEEIWRGLLLVPLLFLLLRKFSNQRKAYIASMLIITFWFAYIHTPGGIEYIIMAIFWGTIYTLPLSFICLHKDLESAIGFHFGLDFMSLFAAYILNSGYLLSF